MYDERAQLDDSKKPHLRILFHIAVVDYKFTAQLYKCRSESSSHEKTPSGPLEAEIHTEPL